MQIFALCILIFSAYMGGLIARKFKIGEVIGQIIGGMVAGPHFLELLRRVIQNHTSLGESIFLTPLNLFFDNSFKEYTEIFEGYHFFVFLFLGLIAFSIGEELHLNRLKQVGGKAAFICLFQAVLTWALLALGFYFIFDFSLINSFIVGSIGIATAPALTFILMSKLKIEGSLRNIVANIIVLADIIEVVLFSIFLGIAVAIKDGGPLSFAGLTLGVLTDIVLSLAIGMGIFLVLKIAIKEEIKFEQDQPEAQSLLSTILSEHPTPSVEVFLLMTAVVGIGISIAIKYHLPFLITAVSAGFLISNLHSHAIFDSLKIGNVMPILNLFFFAIIGASVRLESFSGDTIIYVVVYVVFRLIGKLSGNWIGCKVTDQDPKITACLPQLMLPQAGMAAVETIFVAAVLKGAGGEIIFDTIIPAIVIFEISGAWLSEQTLLKWKSWTTGEKEAMSFAVSSEMETFTMHEIIGSRVFELMARTKDEAIFELAQFLTKDKIIPDTTIITNSAMEREQLASTGIGDGIALPHCRTGAIGRTIVACGLLRYPVEWGSPDKKPVDLLFMIVTPDEFPEQHLQAIRTIMYALKGSDFKEKIKKALIRGELESYLMSLSDAPIENIEALV